MASFHAGLEVADKTTAICVLDNSGKAVFEASVATAPSAIAAALSPCRRMLIDVGQETGTKAAWLHAELLKRRFPMVCLDARHTHAALAAKANKTDANDARGIAILLCRGHFRNGPARPRARNSATGRRTPDQPLRTYPRERLAIADSTT